MRRGIMKRGSRHAFPLFRPRACRVRGAPRRRQEEHVATAKAENEDLMLTVTLHIDPADIKELIGNDLGGHYIVAEVNVEPKFGKDIRRSTATTSNSAPIRTARKPSPTPRSQIAGSGALIIGHGRRNEGVASPGWTGTGFRSSGAAARPGKRRSG